MKNTKKIDMSRTVDNWKVEPGPKQRKPHQPPTFSPRDVKEIEKRISNWGRKNF